VLLAGGKSINKREDNMARDKRVTRQLRGRGWKVIRIWQHALQKSSSACLNRIRRALTAYGGTDLCLRTLRLNLHLRHPC
jgi:hypothetical protein